MYKICWRHSWHKTFNRAVCDVTVEGQLRLSNLRCVCFCHRNSPSVHAAIFSNRFQRWPTLQFFPFASEWRSCIGKIFFLLSAWHWFVVIWESRIHDHHWQMRLFAPYGRVVSEIRFSVWHRVVSRAGLFGSGSGLSLSKCFGPISGLHTELFYNIQSNDFFLSWCTFVVLTAVISVSKVIVIFLQPILFENTATLCCSLLGLVSHCFWEGNSGEEFSTRWHCFEEINHSRDSWLVLRNDDLQTGFSCL